ncbi:MAG: SPOR domain-containing protein [Acidobacteria bacterium]|nr:SPOR domain-containing protein [Acidobacteriota bacterium]
MTTDTRETSWYEIALTQSQIVKIFVVLLLCLVGAFFSGVWIGRDAARSIQDVGVPLAAVASMEGAVEGSEVAQLNFFSDDEVVPTGTIEPASQPAVPVAGSGSTLVDDLRTGAAALEAERSATRVADATPVRNEPDAPVTVTRETSAAVAEATGELVVQVFASNDATQARRVLGRLAQRGHPAYLSPIDIDGRTMYRVRIGPYSERARAESVADSVRRTFKLDTWVTQKST